MRKRQKIRLGIILFSFFLFPATFYYLSPVLIVQAAAGGVVNGSFIVFGLLFLSSLLVGRAWCGWVCPAAGCQEALFPARNRKVTRGDIFKWVFWVPWICAIILLAVKSGGYERIDFLYETTYGFSIGDVYGLITYLTVLLVLVAFPAYLVGRRSFCHHLCWMAPFMILGRKARNLARWPSLGLSTSPERCVHCHTCTDNCPMSLPVETMVGGRKLEKSECILCGSCIDGCEYGVLGYSFSRNKR